ncbi:MAG: Ig-like domain-containing protein, partial [Prevotella sp.]|nr:Ig-like domain-containing protein [Prevotella sp.]
LYQYDDEDGMINLITGSENENTAEEHFALMVEEGIYFILVNGYSGYDAENDYQLGIGYSDTYDAAEIDDTFAASTVVNMPFSVTGTIDNPYDYDFIKFTLTQSGAVTLSLNNDGSTDNIYRMDLYNSSGTAIGYLTQGQKGRATLAAGNYYIRTRATTYGGDNTSTYTLTGSFATTAARVNVTSAGNAFIDYGEGKFWRIDHSATVTGTAYDSDGNLLPNANIEICVAVVFGNQIKTASGTTDSQGNFSIELDLGVAAGRNKYDTGVSYHYYDVEPIYFYSNGEQIRSNISYIYHYAYSVYHPF